MLYGCPFDRLVFGKFGDIRIGTNGPDTILLIANDVIGVSMQLFSLVF